MLVAVVVWIHVIDAYKDAQNVHDTILNYSEYNPEVIQDRWRRINQRDFNDIRDFAQKKCYVYQPELTGEIEEFDTFETVQSETNTYENYQELERTFSCDRLDDEIGIRLDGGFDTEENFDFVNVSSKLVSYEPFSGSINNVPVNLRQKNFKFLGSNELYMKFKADFGIVGKGFKFDVKCRSATTTEQATIQVKHSSSEMTNWSKGLQCLRQHERINYRTQMINSDFQRFARNHVAIVAHNNDQETKQPLVLGNEWIDTESNSISVILVMQDDITTFSDSLWECKDLSMPCVDVNDSALVSCDTSRFYEGMVDELNTIMSNIIADYNSNGLVEVCLNASRERCIREYIKMYHAADNRDERESILELYGTIIMFVSRDDDGLHSWERLEFAHGALFNSNIETAARKIFAMARRLYCVKTEVKQIAVSFTIEARCFDPVKNDIDLTNRTFTPVNKTLMDTVYQISHTTVVDFIERYNDHTQTDEVQKIVRNQTATEYRPSLPIQAQIDRVEFVDGIYVMHLDKANEIDVRRTLRKDLCEQYVTTQLVAQLYREFDQDTLFDADFTEVKLF